MSKVSPNHTFIKVIKLSFSKLPRKASYRIRIGQVKDIRKIECIASDKIKDIDSSAYIKKFQILDTLLLSRRMSQGNKEKNALIYAPCEINSLTFC